MTKSTTSIPDRDWTQADYVIIGDTWAYKSDLGGAARWIVSGLFGADHEELKQYAEGRGLPILPARLVTEGEWAEVNERQELQAATVREVRRSLVKAKAEIERLREERKDLYTRDQVADYQTSEALLVSAPLRAELDQLRAAVARVEALADEYGHVDIDDAFHPVADDIRAALAGEVDHEQG